MERGYGRRRRSTMPPNSIALHKRKRSYCFTEAYVHASGQVSPTRDLYFQDLAHRPPSTLAEGSTAPTARGAARDPQTRARITEGQASTDTRCTSEQDGQPRDLPRSRGTHPVGGRPQVPHRHPRPRAGTCGTRKAHPEGHQLTPHVSNLGAHAVQENILETLQP